jgi:hypothetical protein
VVSDDFWFPIISEWNILEDILKDQKELNAQIQSVEQELANNKLE